MSIHSRPRTLAEMAGIVDEPVSATQMGRPASEPSYESSRAGENRLQNAFDFALSQLPDENLAPSLHSEFKSFRETAFAQGAGALQDFSNRIKTSAQFKVDRDEDERQEALNELCGGGDKAYTAPREIVDRVIKAALERDLADSSIVDEKGFFNKRLESVREVAGTLIINNSLSERASFRIGYNEERQKFNAESDPLFSAEILDRESEPLVESVITSIVENLGAELNALRYAKVARVAIGDKMTPRQQQEAMLRVIQGAKTRIATGLLLKLKDSELSRIAEKLLKESSYADVAQDNMILLGRKKNDFVTAMTSVEKITKLSTDLSKTQEYKEFMELGVHQGKEDFTSLEINVETLSGLSESQFTTFLKDEARSLARELGSREAAVKSIRKKYARRMHPDVVESLGLNEEAKDHITELNKILLSLDVIMKNDIEG